MRHARWLIILCVAVIVSFTALLGRAVMSVSDVYVTFSVYGDEDVESATEIVNSYKNDFLPFVNLSEIERRLNENTQLKVESIEKRFPNKLNVVLSERKDFIAVKHLDRYYFFDEEYKFIESRETLKSSSDNLDMVLLEFDKADYPQSSFLSRQPLDIGNEPVLKAVKSMISKIDNPRDFLKSVRIEERYINLTYYVYFTTLEGVEIEIRNVFDVPEKKIEAGINKYLTLTDSEKLKEKIAVYKLDSGEIRAVFTTN